MPLKILVADDSLTMRKIMEMTFAGEDADVVVVENGEACVRAASQVGPDVVFADLSMSGMDGYGVAQAIKSQPGLGNTAVIVMASQHAAYDEGRGQGAGVDDHIVKPFDTQSVIDKVADVLKRPRMIPSGGAAAPGPGAHPYREVAHQPPPPPPQQTAKKSPVKSTVAFGGQQRPPPPPSRQAPPERPVLELADEPAAPPTPAARPSSRPAPPSAVALASAGATASGGDLARKLEGLGLNAAQLEGVLALSREVIEQVVWEVVPDLAETMIREELRRLTAD